MSSEGINPGQIVITMDPFRAAMEVDRKQVAAKVKGISKLSNSMLSEVIRMDDKPLRLLRVSKTWKVITEKVIVTEFAKMLGRVTDFNEVYMLCQLLFCRSRICNIDINPYAATIFRSTVYHKIEDSIFSKELEKRGIKRQIMSAEYIEKMRKDIREENLQNYENILDKALDHDLVNNVKKSLDALSERVSQGNERRSANSACAFMFCTWLIASALTCGIVFAVDGSK